jgi:hypothetical protein
MTRTANRATLAPSLVALAFCLSVVVSVAGAGTAAELFRDADLKLGEQLIKEHRCVECHVQKFGGDGSSIYRPQGRINAPGFLRGMVEQCNTELNLGLFPEEVTAVAAVLNRDHYRFK